MKYPTEIPLKIKILFILFFAGSVLFCAHPEVVNAIDEEEFPESSGKGNPDLLRLTYDIAFRPPPGYTLVEKGNLHEKGNVYRIKFPIELNGFAYLKISSTNSENSSRFVYEISEAEIQKARWKKYFYLPVQGKPNSATISLFSCGKDQSCARWEWNYNGFLVVFESKGNFKESDVSQKTIAENYHQIIEKHLLVY